MSIDKEQIEEIVRTSRAAQGLPPKIEDPAVTARLATMIHSQYHTAGKPADPVE